MKKIVQKLTIARQQILAEYPFYGMLLMNLKFGLMDCETAFTDMERIVFDPDFIEILSLEELEFVMQHELLHCVLHHCTRGKGMNQELYNIACDIVVNSNILSSMGKTQMFVAGEEVMHLVPDGSEGCLYTAEQVYQMLVKELDFQGTGFAEGFGVCDCHDFWDEIEHGVLRENEWKEYLEEASSALAGSGQIPAGIRKILDDGKYQSKLDWRDILRDFLKLHADDFDYTYKMPDRRYLYMDMVYPGFYEMMNEEIDGIYFFADTSGSISTKMLTEILNEVKAALEQTEGLRGWLSFFDTKVYEAMEIDSVQSLEKVQPLGGGGTNFFEVFRYLKEIQKEKNPKAVVILTDGYASFPNEQAALGIPVLWIIGHSNVKPPWGRYVKYQE